MQSLKSLSPSSPALFLDRDGILNRDVGYAYQLKDLELMPGAIDLLKIAAKNYRLIVVTNQSGIARGIYNVEQMRQFNDALQREISDLGGPKFDAIYWCPHLPTGSVPVYARKCRCRKPESGMIIAAAEYLNIDLSRSFMIGDKSSDIEAATNIGLRGIQVGHGLVHPGAYAHVEDLQMAAAIIATTIQGSGD